jgi:hypothetical protein
MNSITMKVENITKKTKRSFGPQQLVLTPQETGWYYNAETNTWVFYDANTRLLYPQVSLPSWPYSKVAISPGDTVRVTVSFSYTGPAVSSLNSRWAIGVNGSFGFDEKIYVTPALSISANLSSSPAARTFVQNLTITSGVATNWDDIYMKIWGGSPSIGGSEAGPAFLIGYNDVFTIVGNEPTITDINITGITKV